MEASHVRSAVNAAMATAAGLGMKVEDAVVLQDSNRLAVRLLPCDVLVRVAHAVHREGARFELEIAGSLSRTGSPVAGPDPRVEPRVYLNDGFALTLWMYHQPIAPGEVEAVEYAHALERLHAGMREIELPSPHFTDRVAHAEHLVSDPVLTPELEAHDRDLLGATFRRARSAIAQSGAPEQLLHGEPHPGNLLRANAGLLFVDFETACRGPVEFDVAHAPERVSEHYKGADKGLVAECRLLMTALVAAWRWDRDDLFPDGHRMGTELLSELRAAAEGHQLDGGSLTN
jgi:aminoglycoside phosphotransferase (APT) family kinase protein